MILSRRHFLSLAATLPGLFAFSGQISTLDDAFLEDLSRRAFLFFWEHSDPNTGLVLDRVRNDGTAIPWPQSGVASTALTGFGRSQRCVLQQTADGWIRIRFENGCGPHSVTLSMIKNMLRAVLPFCESQERRAGMEF